jgi:hypothetical protein
MAGKKIPLESDSNFNSITDTMKKNYKFLLTNAKEPFGKFNELMNDVIDLMGYGLERKEFGKYSMVFYIHQILIPSSYTIYLHLLLGNVPACFRELRLALELLIKSYCADNKFQNMDFFKDKMEALQNEMDTRRTTITKLMNDFGVKTQCNQEAVDLWRDLSKEWTHAPGIVNRIIQQTTNKSKLPSWSIIIPVTYEKADLDTINDLGKKFAIFKSILRVTLEHYKQEFNL